MRMFIMFIAILGEGTATIPNEKEKNVAQNGNKNILSRSNETEIKER